MRGCCPLNAVLQPGWVGIASSIPVPSVEKQPRHAANCRTTDSLTWRASTTGRAGDVAVVRMPRRPAPPSSPRRAGDVRVRDRVLHQRFRGELLRFAKLLLGTGHTTALVADIGPIERFDDKTLLARIARFLQLAKRLRHGNFFPGSELAAASHALHDRAC